MLNDNISSNRQLRHGSDWLVAMRSSWPFRWRPCGPIRLAGLHSVKHESVRRRKAAPFQKMSNCYDRSLLELYYLEDSWQRLTHVLQLTGIMICIQMLVQINNICVVHKHQMFSKRGEKSARSLTKWKNEESARAGKSTFLWSYALSRGRVCCTGPVNASKRSN